MDTIVVQAWRTIPFATVIFIAGISSIPQEVDDAAAIDGATGLKKFWYVSLPLQLPIAVVAILFGIIFTATDIVVPYILTNGGPFNSTQVLTTLAFQTGINAGNVGEGAAIALLHAPAARHRDDRDAPLRSAGGGHVTQAWRHRLFSYGVVIPFAIVLAFIFVWMGVTWFKNQAQVYDPDEVWSFHPTLANYGYLFHQTDYLRWMKNSCFVGLMVVLITLAVAMPARSRSHGSPGGSAAVSAWPSSSPTSSRRRCSSCRSRASSRSTCT